ncbi:hypothetical protein [Psychrobacter sp.]|uniref:hypothetical protein n=1 Tax=Psychrobacter sp. TaxID=56811 RepID=UPI0025F2E91C|nr:hypothetical protein [Psychrobacter sp.]
MQKLKTFNKRPMINFASPVSLTMLIASSLLLFGCNNSTSIETTPKTETTQSSISADTADTTIETKANTVSIDGTEDNAGNEQISTRENPITIDWSRIDSAQKAVNAENFNYPFKLDSDPVKSQAKYSNITPKQAQYALTVGMASNEPLEKLLDQLGDSYLSHKFSESDAKLFIYTTPNVAPSQHDYIISHEFARGLTLPIEIVPQSKTTDGQPLHPKAVH